MQLSKSEYIMFLKHPAWLWLKKHDKTKLPEIDDNLQATFDAGSAFEAHAQKRFPDGVRLGFEDFKEYASLLKRTQEALESGVKTIFQGRFETENLTCICDVIDRVEGNTFDLYEIKSSTKVKPEHYPDLAFQVIVLEEAGLKVRNIAVIHVNNEYVRNGDVDFLALSAVADITESVRDIIEETKKNIQIALKVVEMAEMPDPSPRFCKLGSLGEWLEIYKNLGKEIDPYSIYNLGSPGASRIGELEDLNVEMIEDIPEGFELTTKQLGQYLATKNDERIIDYKKINNFVKSLEYPLYFLDYETAMDIIPLYDKSRPYQQMPFQYSLHIIEKPGDEPRHSEYLHRDSGHPVPGLLEKLRNDIGPVGNVIVWYKTFEMGRNREMAEMYPEFAEFLENVNSRVVDLMDPFSNGWFVDKDFFGSSSIKKVLPVVVPSLSYKDLGIHEGASAQRLWMDAVIRNKTGMDKEKLFFDLVEYCKMDTLAMVEIWRALEGL